MNTQSNVLDLKYQITYHKLILNQIKLYQNEIIINLKLNHFIQEENLKLIENNTELVKNNKELEKLVFSRLNTVVNTTICSFCKKIAYYEDTDNKLYCWFHRIQHED
jgi:hypothetical protein